MIQGLLSWDRTLEFSNLLILVVPLSKQKLDSSRQKKNKSVTKILIFKNMAKEGLAV